MGRGKQVKMVPVRQEMTARQRPGRPGDRETGRQGDKATRPFSSRLLVSLSPYRPLSLAAACLLVCLLTGCPQDNRRPADPMTGPVGGGGTSIGSPGAPAVPVAPAVPPLPVAGGGTQSNAALASGAGARPLPGGTDLRIGSPNTPGTWQGQSGGSGAALQPPQPAAQPVSSVRGVSPAGPRVTSYEQAMALLAAKGVQWRRLETIGDQNQSQFSCSIPNPQNPYISRTYEARAATDLDAIQAVIDQISKDSAGGLQ
jgi:hypothetical protein